MARKIEKYWFVFALAIIVIFASCNPFAPRLSDQPLNSVSFDQKTIDGFFKNFRNAYLYRDTILYGRLLSDDFIFTYHNYDDVNNPPVSWGRDVDMTTTYNLFQASRSLDLVWNDIIATHETTIGDTILNDITRSLNLVIIFPTSNSDIISIKGKASFRLRKIGPNDVWRIVTWDDETDVE